MEKIYIGFSRNRTGILSRIICLGMGTDYSHVYIRRDSKYGEYVYQASGLAVNFMNAEIFREKNIIVEEYEFKLPEQSRDKVLGFFIKYAGRPYGMKALLKLAIIMLGRRFGFSPKFQMDGEASFVCSELGNVFARDVLLIRVPDSIADAVTPLDLNPYIAAAGKRVI